MTTTEGKAEVLAAKCASCDRAISPVARETFPSGTVTVWEPIDGGPVECPAKRRPRYCVPAGWVVSRDGWAGA